MKKTIFALILLMGFLIKLGFFVQQNSIWWDASVYIGMAKYFVTGGSSGLIEPLRPIIWPLLLSFLMILKTNYLLLAKLIQLFFSLATVFLVYRIAKILWGVNDAMISALLLLFTPVITFYEPVLLTEIPAVFFAVLSFYLFINQKYFFSGFFIGLSFLTKFPLGLLLVALFLGVYKEKINLIKIFIGFMIPAGAILLFNYFFYESFLLPFLDGIEVFSKSGWFYDKGLFFYLIELIKENIFLIFALLALFQFKKRKEFVLALLFLLPFLYFGYIIHKEVRFYILFLPFLCLIASRGIANFLSLKYGKFILIFLFLIFVNLSYGRFVDYYNFRDNFDQEYYTLIKDYDAEGRILVSDPRFVLFTEKKLIPLYYKDYNEQHLLENLQNASLIILNKCDIPCSEKSECHEKMFAYLNENMLLNKSILRNDCEISVYLKNILN